MGCKALHAWVCIYYLIRLACEQNLKLLNCRMHPSKLQQGACVGLLGLHGLTCPCVTTGLRWMKTAHGLGLSCRQPKIGSGDCCCPSSLNGGPNNTTWSTVRRTALTNPLCGCRSSSGYECSAKWCWRNTATCLNGRLTCCR
jgi:hypothetical protein